MVIARVKSLDAPDEETSFPLGHGHVVRLAGLTIGRSIHEPGWRWSTHLKPMAGTETCRSHHVGYIVSGRMRWVLDDGTSVDGGPGDAFDIPPGHDSMVIGDETVVTIDWAGVAGADWESLGAGTVSTLLLTDIVDSTVHASHIGPTAWARLLESHREVVRLVLHQRRGTEVKSTGDGILATFESTANAVRAAAEIRDRLLALGLRIRSALHTGEVERIAGDIRGVAVHEVARILELAAAGEIVASGVTRDLAGPGLAWADRGEHDLRGLEGRRRLFVLA
jgi:class 3 adenylate cyclase